MRITKYTGSELWVKDDLERLFWIEVAKRKARLVEPDAFHSMIELRREVTIWFERHAAALVEPFEDGADYFWDAVQFGSCDCPSVESAQELVDQAVGIFGKRGWDLMQTLSCHKGFYMADFSVVTDLVLLNAWWMYITSKEGKDALNSKGLFGSSGEPRAVEAKEELRFHGHEHPTVVVGEKVMTTSTMSMPVRAPRRLIWAKIRSWNTDENEVMINGALLKNRLMLEIDLSAKMPSMREVELKIRSAFQSQRAERWSEMLDSGVIDESLLLESDDIPTQEWTRLILPPTEDHKLMTAHTSARPFIFGLHGDDLMYSGLTKTCAARQSLSDLKPPGGQQNYSERRAMYGIEIVQARINEYESSSLPWDSL